LNNTYTSSTTRTITLIKLTLQSNYRKTILRCEYLMTGPETAFSETGTVYVVCSSTQHLYTCGAVRLSEWVRPGRGSRTYRPPITATRHLHLHIPAPPRGLTLRPACLLSTPELTRHNANGCTRCNPLQPRQGGPAAVHGFRRAKRCLRKPRPLFLGRSLALHVRRRRPAGATWGGAGPHEDVRRAASPR
jgi:hypothetical protein